VVLLVESGLWPGAGLKRDSGPVAALMSPVVGRLRRHSLRTASRVFDSHLNDLSKEPNVPMTTQQWMETVRTWMEEQIPFNVHLGLKISELESGRITMEIPFAPHLVGDSDRPALHGGVISMLADTAGGAAVFTKVDPGSRLSTVDLRVDYLRPARLEALCATAEVIRLGNRVGVAQVRVFQGSLHVADGRAVYNIRRGVSAPPFP